MVKSSTEIQLGLALRPKRIWADVLNEWSLKKNSGKPIFMSRNGRAYKEISGVELLQLKDKL